MKSNSINLSWIFELTAWVATAVLTFIILLPIFRNVPDYIFLSFNIAAVVVFLTLVRYIFLLRATPFSRFAPVKVVFIFIAIPLIIYLLDGLTEFQYHLDEHGTYSMVSHLSISKQIPISNYIRSEMLFFTVGAIISSAILPVRMIVSLWRVKNRNKV